MTDDHLTLEEEIERRGAKRGFEDDEGNRSFDDEAAWKEQEHVFADNVDEDGPFFGRRGVLPAIKAARRYRYWEPEHPEPLLDAWRPFLKLRKLNGKLVDNPEQLGSVRGWAKQVPGYIITRHEPPGIGAPRIAPEIRPLDPVDTSPAYLQQNRLAAGKERKLAKYVHCPTPKKETEHDHAAMDPKDRPHHIRQEHKGEDVSGPHIHRVKDKERGQAKRLDLHPRAVSLFENATRVFFAIEGCIKADSILSRGEAVFSVPSVTLWNAPELRAFARKCLADADAIVFIVADADWYEKWQVNAQALLCRNRLRGLGLRAFVVAPTTAKDERGKLRWKGVDDFLGAGHSVDDLVVIGREMPAEFEQWMAEQAARRTEAGRFVRGQGVSRDAAVLQALALVAGLRDEGMSPERSGELRKSVGTITAIVNSDPRVTLSRDSVSRAIKSLAERPGLTKSHRAIKVEGSLALAEGGWKDDYYDHSIGWEEGPVIRVAPELCAVERDPIRVGDLTEDLVLAPLEQFVRHDTTLERIRELRRANT